MPAGSPGQASRGYGEFYAATFFTQTTGLLPERVMTCNNPGNGVCTTLFVQHLVDTGQPDPGHGRHWANPTLVRRTASQEPRWQFLGPNRWFLADGARLWSTANAGRTWHALSSLPNGLVPAEISFVNAAHGWVIGRSPRTSALGYPNAAAIFATSDGGRRWRKVPLP